MKLPVVRQLAGWLALALCSSARADPAALSGSGNCSIQLDLPIKAQMEALQAAGARAIRMDIYPYDYYDGKNPLPERADARVLEAHAAGVEKIILLFEFAGQYQHLAHAPIPIGGYDKWRAIGQAYAARFAPNSAWLRSHGISDWGIAIYEAFNEPDDEKPADAIAATGPESYYTALRGLADGIHSVNPGLAVIPAGFMAACSWSDYTLRGYGPALAPLWNDGTLAGIDLHTYNDVDYAPIVQRDGTAVTRFSPQANFDAIKEACHLTRDIDFYTTEYNFKAHEQGIDDNLAAKRLLTCIWANLGVVKNDGRTSATRLALIWNLFNTEKDDPPYGLDTALTPWTPSPRGKVFQAVLALTKGMEFTSLDPKGHGAYILEGGGRKLWVWQNYPNWTDTPGSSFVVHDIPATATKLEIYGWDGLRGTIPLSGNTSYTVDHLAPNETYMFLTRS